MLPEIERAIPPRLSTVEPPTDAELDAFVRVRLRLIGIDLGVLPEDDPSAPADQLRTVRSVRSFLRSTVPQLSAFELDPQRFPPVLYPASLPLPPDGRLPEVRERGGDSDGGHHG
jgi:hypothetical protein